MGAVRIFLICFFVAGCCFSEEVEPSISIFEFRIARELPDERRPVAYLAPRTQIHWMVSIPDAFVIDVLRKKSKLIQFKDSTGHSLATLKEQRRSAQGKFLSLSDSMHLRYGIWPPAFPRYSKDRKTMFLEVKTDEEPHRDAEWIEFEGTLAIRVAADWKGEVVQMESVKAGTQIQLMGQDVHVAFDKRDAAKVAFTSDREIGLIRSVAFRCEDGEVIDVENRSSMSMGGKTFVVRFSMPKDKTIDAMTVNYYHDVKEREIKIDKRIKIHLP